MDRLAAERMFVKVVETGGFATAAARLGTSSGQASKLVARLEADLGVKLLNRTTRALSLTEAGQAYADRLRGLIEAFDDLATEVQNAAVAPRGQVRLTAPLSFGTIRLAPLLARFAADYPDIGLDVQFTDRIVNLVDEGFDAAIRVGTPTDAALTGRRLCSAQVIVVAAPAYLDRHSTRTHRPNCAGTAASSTRISATRISGSSGAGCACRWQDRLPFPMPRPAWPPPKRVLASPACRISWPNTA